MEEIRQRIVLNLIIISKMIEKKQVFDTDFCTVVLVYGDLLVLKEAILSYSWLNPLSILKV